MKGIEISERFYLEYGKPMLDERFSEILPFLAIGLIGSGSECFAFDDDISRDHDFEPGFCIFLPDEAVVDRRTSFALERAYSKLPSEFMGIKRAPLSPVGGNRHGVIRLNEFLKAKTGCEDGELSFSDWVLIPEQSLAEITNGRVFFDGYGELSKIREKLAYMPEDVRLKKLAGELLLMGQAGQYNYQRLLLRSEFAGAQLAIYEYVKSAIHAIFLINKVYAPYYKWSFRALSQLPVLSELYGDFEYLISNDNNEQASKIKNEKIEQISKKIVGYLKEKDFTCFRGDELEGHAYSVNERVIDSNIRNLHILSAV